MRDEKRICEATTIRADGVVLVQFHHIFLTNTTPALTFLVLQSVHTFVAPRPIPAHRNSLSLTCITAGAIFCATFRSPLKRSPS